MDQIVYLLKRRFQVNFLVLALCISGVFYSCVSQKSFVYFQDKKGQDTAVFNHTDTSYRAIIQTNDILTIFVASLSPEAGKYFNFSENPNETGSMANGYLVDGEGYVHIPLKVHVSGLTSGAASDSIVKKLEKYLINPSVKLNIRNFRVTILGEVKEPGLYTVQNEKITLPEALGLAGDLTVFSNRTNIMIIRDSGVKKEFGIVDLTSRDVFASPYFNLHSNDVIYIEPIKAKKFTVQSYYKVLPVMFGGVALLLALYQVLK